MSLKYEEITEAITGSAFEVYNILGYGFLEKVYQRALQVELLRRGYSAEIEHAIRVQNTSLSVNMQRTCWLITKLSLNSKWLKNTTHKTSRNYSMT